MVQKDRSINLILTTSKGKLLQRYSIMSLFQDENHYLVIEAWKIIIKNGGCCLRTVVFLWHLTKNIIEKKSYRIKIPKMASTRSPEQILELSYIPLGLGSTLGNIEDSFNVRCTYKIIKYMAAVKVLHR